MFSAECPIVRRPAHSFSTACGIPTARGHACSRSGLELRPRTHCSCIKWLETTLNSGASDSRSKRARKAKKARTNFPPLRLNRATKSMTKGAPAVEKPPFPREVCENVQEPRTKRDGREAERLVRCPSSIRVAPHRFSDVQDRMTGWPGRPQTTRNDPKTMQKLPRSTQKPPKNERTAEEEDSEAARNAAGGSRVTESYIRHPVPVSVLIADRPS